MYKLKTFSLALIFTMTISSPTFAQTGDQPDELQAIYKCKSIAAPEERLACYDNSVGRFQEAEKSGNVVAVSKKAIEKVERDAFGFNIPSLPSLSGIFGRNEKRSDATQKKLKENDLTAPIKQVEREKSTPAPTQPPAINTRPTPSKVSEVTLNVRKTTEFGRDKTRFFMTNGQVWEQVGASRTRIAKKKPGKDYTAEISKAALGSFMMRVNGKGAAIRVRRVR